MRFGEGGGGAGLEESQMLMEEVQVDAYHDSFYMRPSRSRRIPTRSVEEEGHGNENGCSQDSQFVLVALLQ